MFLIHSITVICLFISSCKEGSGLCYQEKYAEKWRQMIS